MHCPAPGATIAVVAPASPCPADLLSQVSALIEARGWRARLYPGCSPGEAPHDYLAAGDDQRLADLQAALDDPTVAAVWCLRGGYGSNRLLPRLDLSGLQARPKPLLGYSDITALHALFDRAGLLALHAPMPASDLVLAGHEADADLLFGWLAQGMRAGTVLAPRQLPGGLRRSGRAQGRLMGGNLSMLAALCGTPWHLRPPGRLLFIEEVGDAPYRIDRMLWQLEHSGALHGLAGLLLGSFTQAADPTAVLTEYLGQLGLPVLGGWPSGHGSPNHLLPLGAMATLDADAGTLTIDQDVLLPCD